MNAEHSKIVASMVILAASVGRLRGYCDVLSDVCKRLDHAVNHAVADVDILGVDAATLLELASRLDAVVAELEPLSPTMRRIYFALPRPGAAPED